MNISEKLLYIHNKISLYDFDFDYDFIESLKLTNGLYEIFEISLLKKLGIAYINNNIIENIDNDYIKFIYELLIWKLDIYNFNNSKTYFLELYNQFDYYISNTNDEIMKHYLYIIKKTYYSFLIIYFDNINEFKSLLNYEEKPINIKFIKVIQSFDKKDFINFNILAQDILDSNDCTNSLKIIINIFKLIIIFTNSITVETANYIIDNIKLLYGDLLHPLLQKIYKLHVYLIKYKLLIFQFNNNNNLYLFDFNYIPSYENTYEFCKHIYMTNLFISNKDEYYIYLNTLYHNKSVLLTGVITDLLAIIFNNKKYNLILDIYNNLKDFIIYNIKKHNNPHITNNIPIIILNSMYYDNKLCLIEKFPIDIDITLDKIKNKINDFKEYLTDKNYTINYKNNMNDICLICYEEIKEDIISTISCQSCKKELGHYMCLLKWLFNDKYNMNKCPNCRN
jgi:hypothetical protein